VSKTVNVAFNITEQVCIKELQLTGTVVAINLNLKEITYLVRYFWEGDLKELWLYDFEIRSL